MPMWGWRLYLIGGLILHKAIWEALKIRRRGRAEGSETNREQPLSLGVRLIKLGKVAALLGLAAQTLWLEIWPISDQALALRAVGAAIYTLGLVMAILGRVQLGENWSDIETARVLSQQSVVSRGIYRYIRHPIYVGDLLLVTGLELSLNSWLVLGVILLMPVVIWKALREEEMLKATLPGYAEYCRQTRRFIPFIV